MESEPTSSDDKQPSTARNLFAACENVMPLPFFGMRAFLMTKAGTIPPSTWTVASSFKLCSGAQKPTAIWLSAAGGYSGNKGCASAALEVNPNTGDWNLETVGLPAASENIRAIASARVTKWNQFTKFCIDVDHWSTGNVYTVSVDPVRKRCGLQMLQMVTSRLSLGSELKFNMEGGSIKKMVALQPAVMIKYVGPTFVLSSKVWPTANAIKFGYYQHCSDSLHVAITATSDEARGQVVGRLGVRALHWDGAGVAKAAVSRAAIDTTGVFTYVLDLRLNDRLSVSWTSCFKRSFRDYKFGVGLSFE